MQHHRAQREAMHGTPVPRAERFAEGRVADGLNVEIRVDDTDHVRARPIRAGGADVGDGSK